MNNISEQASKILHERRILMEDKYDRKKVWRAIGTGWLAAIGTGLVASRYHFGPMLALATGVGAGKVHHDKRSKIHYIDKDIKKTADRLSKRMTSKKKKVLLQLKMKYLQELKKLHIKYIPAIDSNDRVQIAKYKQECAALEAQYTNTLLSMKRNSK